MVQLAEGHVAGEQPGEVMPSELLNRSLDANHMEHEVNARQLCPFELIKAAGFAQISLSVFL